MFDTSEKTAQDTR